MEKSLMEAIKHSLYRTDIGVCFMRLVYRFIWIVYGRV